MFLQLSDQSCRAVDENKSRSQSGHLFGRRPAGQMQDWRKEDAAADAHDAADESQACADQRAAQSGDTSREVAGWPVVIARRDKKEASCGGERGREEEEKRRLPHRKKSAEVGCRDGKREEGKTAPPRKMTGVRELGEALRRDDEVAGKSKNGQHRGRDPMPMEEGEIGGAAAEADARVNQCDEEKKNGQDHEAALSPR